jgi:ferredoxin-nitrate reductase
MGAIDEDFIINHTDGFDQYKELVFKKTVKEAASICGVKAEDIRWTVEYISRAKGFLTMWTMGLNQSVIGVNKNLSLINLSLITGHIGKPGSGPFSLTGQPNAMGGREVGGLANLLPAHRNLADPKHRAEVQEFWGGTTIADKPGLTATEMFEALASGKMKAIWIVCTNPLVSIPNLSIVEKGLANAKFVVVQDISNKSDSIKYADLVLPAAAWAEKEGTMTNSERRISYLNKIVEPPGEALADTEIICRFARKMGFHGFDYDSFSEVYDEHARLTEGTNIDVSGLNYNILKMGGTVQWPYPKEGNILGTARLFTDKKFYTPNKRAQIHACPDHNESEPLSEDFPLILNTGRIRDQWHTMTKTGKVNKLNQHIPESFLEINPKDAESRGIEEGMLVEVKNDRGVVRVKARLTKDIKKGVVFMPMHWGKILKSDLNRVNNLTSPLIDARSKEPDLKFAAVQVQKYLKPKQKILVIGAGAGAFGFVKTYRELNQTDDITVFSKENFPFYNRVMLPDYLSGTQQWHQLVKMHDEEEKAYNIQLKRGVSVVQIDREKKEVTDSNGEIHQYDMLFLGTGSSPAMPKDVPPLKGIFTMRSRYDADNFKNYIPNNSHIVIVGGGLLGLELAASLREIDMTITVIQRSSRLMDRQLDVLGSQLLHEEMLDKGVEIFYNDEVQNYIGHEKLESIKLKSGREIHCDAMVFAIGTVPNTELAKKSGLTCQRGVVVNEYLQTSDPNIYAVGEMAEFKGNLYGITAAAEQQAEIVAKYLHGDISQYYQGSLLMNILKMEGVNICSLGMVDCPDSPDYEEVVFVDKSKRYYKKCIIYKDKLVGAILMGDKSEFAEFKNLIQNKIELSEKRLTLLRSGKAAEPVIGKLICSCNGVGEGNIVAKIKSGCDKFQELCQQTGAGMGCGSCRPEVKAILEKTLVTV